MQWMWEMGKINCNLSYFCVYSLVIDTYPKVVFSFPGSNELFLLRSRRSLWKCWRHKHRARSQSESICSFRPINEISTFPVSCHFMCTSKLEGTAASRRSYSAELGFPATKPVSQDALFSAACWQGNQAAGRKSGWTGLPAQAQSCRGIGITFSSYRFSFSSCLWSLWKTWLRRKWRLWKRRANKKARLYKPKVDFFLIVCGITPVRVERIVLTFQSQFLYPPDSSIPLHLDILEESCSCCTLLGLPGSGVRGAIPTELQGVARTDL